MEARVSGGGFRRVPRAGRAQAADISESQKSQSPYHYWNYHPYDDRKGYKEGADPPS